MTAALFLACLLLALAPQPAWAHALLMSSRPAPNSAVTGPDITILLRYDSRVDPVRSTLTLASPDGKIRKVTIEAQTAPNLLSAKATGLVLKGTYVLRWQALASDGHITRGEVPFRVQ